MEQAHYDPDSGQLVTGSFADYCLPRADDMPDLSGDLDTSQPCRNNPLGAKGCGESGTVGSVPAIVSAVVDALRPYGIRHLDMPITAQRVWRIIFKEDK
jgi:carbon-monoxide dehydrogenase large subunit